MAGEVTVAIHKITGQPSAVSGCGVFTKRITLADLSVGTLVSCILVHGQGKDLGEVMRGIFEIAEKKLEGSEEGLLAVLEETLAPAKNYAAGVDVDLVHAFFYKQSLRSSSLDELETAGLGDVCYIVRLGQAVRVFLFEPPKSAELNFESGSGPARAGQLYLIATDSFFSIFDTSPLTQAAEVDLEEVVDGIATEIGGEENQSEVGAAFVAITEVSQVKESLFSTSGKAKVSHGSQEEEQREEREEEQETEDGKGEEQTLEAPEEEISGEPTQIPEHKLTEALAHKAREKLTARVIEIPKKISLSVFAEFAKIRRGEVGALRRNIVAVAIVIVLVLAVSVGITIYKKREAAKLAEFNRHVEAASAKYGEAVAILELNRNRAREILVEAERELKLAGEIKKDDERARKLTEDIAFRLKETEVSRDVAFREVANLNDSLKSVGIAGSSLIAISGDKIYEVSLATGEVSDIASGGGIRAGAVYERAVFVTSDSKITRVDLADSKSVDVSERGGGLDVSVFAGNVYVLTENSIRKFVPVASGYAQGTEYLSSPESFSSRSHFAIDGSIWVTAGGNIWKFLRGEKQDFAISGLTHVGEFSLIYTTPNLDNLYVVDYSNSALLVIGKDGFYQKVLQSPEFSRATDLAVDELAEKLYIASGSRILEASL